MIKERAPVDRVSADADAGAHPDTRGLELRRRLIAERSRPADNADRAARIDMAGHDPHHRPIGAYHPSAVRPDQAHPGGVLVAALIALHLHHVLHWYAVGHAYAVLDTGVGGFHDGVRCERRRHEHDARRRVGCGDGLLHRVEHVHPAMAVAATAGGDPAHHIGAVLDHLSGVEGGDASGDPLHQHRRVLVNDDAHDAALEARLGAGSAALARSPAPRTASTARSPASAKDPAVMTSTSAFARIA